MAKRSILKKLTLGMLSTIMATSFVSGLYALNVNGVVAASPDLAVTTTMNTSDVLILQGANAQVQSYDTKYDYTGLTVGSTDDVTPYSGRFDGVFNGSTTVEYKFNGSGTGDSFGAFKWIVRSVKDVTQSYTVEISPNGNTSLQVTRNKIFGYKKLDGSSSQIQYLRNGTTLYGDKSNVAYDHDTKAPSFHTDDRVDSTNSKGTEKLYLEVDATGLSISYQLNDYATKSASLITLDKDSLDISEGYTLEFESNWDPQADYALNANIIGKLQYKVNGTYTEIKEGSEYYKRSCPITFIALNGTTFNSSTLNVSSDSDQVSIGNKDAITSGDLTYILLDENETQLEPFYYFTQGYFTGDTTFKVNVKKTDGLTVEGIEDIDFDRSNCGILGNLSVLYAGNEKQFTIVRKGAENVEDVFSFYGGNLSDSAHAQLKTNKANTDNGETSYKGLQIEGVGAYSGQFSGVFYGSNEIEYKFTGSSKIENEYLLGIANKCDGIGDFYFTITSVANPKQYVKIHITSSTYDVNEDDKYSSAIYSTLYAETVGRDGNIYYYYLGNRTGGGYDGNLIKTANEHFAKHSFVAAPYFHSDNYGVEDIFDHLYINVDDDGILSVNYDRRGTRDNKNTVNYGITHKTRTAPVIAFDGTDEYVVATTGNTYGLDKFDLSKGYTISFGSNFNASNKYLTKVIDDTNTEGTVYKDIEVDLAALGIDGTDICFTKVGGLDLTQEKVILNPSVSVSYDGAYQGVSSFDELIIYLLEDSENIPGMLQENYEISLTDNWKLFEKTKIDEVDINAITGIDKNVIGSQKGYVSVQTVSDELGEYILPVSVAFEKKYTANLVLNGGYLANGTMSIDYSEHIIPDLPVPLFDSVIFEGWYKETQFINKVNAFDLSLGNVTLYAKWVDNIAPVISLKDTPVYEVLPLNTLNIVSSADIYITDNYDGVIDSNNVRIYVKTPNESSYQELNKISFKTLGDYTVRYIITDAAGNENSIERTICIVSAKSPKMTLEQTVQTNGYTNHMITIPRAVVEDGVNVTVTLVYNGEIVFNDFGTYLPRNAGAYMLYYYAVDSKDLYSSLEYVIEIKDDLESPIITLTTKKIEVLINDIVQIEDATVYDNADSNLEYDVAVKYGTNEVQISEGTFVANQFGTYKIYYTVEDMSGNKKTEIVEVVVRSEIIENDDNTEVVPVPPSVQVQENFFVKIWNVIVSIFTAIGKWFLEIFN